MAKTKKSNSAAGASADTATMENYLDGTVASISQSGSLVTDIGNDQVADVPHDESVSIKFGGHETLGIYPTEHGQPDATLVASLGASGFVEIEIVGVSISDMLGLKPGIAVKIAW